MEILRGAAVTGVGALRAAQAGAPHLAVPEGQGHGPADRTAAGWVCAAA